MIRILLTMLIMFVALCVNAAEIQTYRFVVGDNRPFLHTCGECSDTSVAELSGEFDLVVDHAAGTAALTRIDAVFADAFWPESPSQIDAWLQNMPVSAIWPNDLTALPGKLVAPNEIHIAGPGPVHVESFSNWIQIGYSIADFVQILPDGSRRIEGSGYQSAVRIILSESEARVDAAALFLFGDDFGEYYVFNAIATQVPEPASLLMAINGAACWCAMMAGSRKAR